MRIGVVGDTHNQMTNVDTIVELFRAARIERLIHTGDITQPSVLERFARLDVPLVGVFGNNDDSERERLAREAARLGMDLADPPRTIEWAGRRILVVHDPEASHHAHPDGGSAGSAAALDVRANGADRLAGHPAPIDRDPSHDLVLHGHTHRHRLERRGGTLIFNPGECAGFLAGGNAVGLVDLVSLEAELLRF
jgi:putative phosphoesterase